MVFISENLLFPRCSSRPPTSFFTGQHRAMDYYLTRLLLVLVTLNSLPATSQMFPGLQTSNSSTVNALSAFELSQMPVTAETTRPLSCGVCQVGGPNVDDYYWPQANPNTSCLSIIGPTPSPPMAGATMLNGANY